MRSCYKHLHLTFSLESTLLPHGGSGKAQIDHEGSINVNLFEGYFLGKMTINPQHNDEFPESAYASK